MSRPPFWIHDDRARGLSLLRGDVHDLLTEAGVLDRARWSISMRGWVVTVADATDVCVVAETWGRPYRVKQVSAG